MAICGLDKNAVFKDLINFLYFLKIYESEIYLDNSSVIFRKISKYYRNMQGYLEILQEHAGIFGYLGNTGVILFQISKYPPNTGISGYLENTGVINFPNI